jgi:hypothetical protein
MTEDDDLGEAPENADVQPQDRDERAFEDRRSDRDKRREEKSFNRLFRRVHDAEARAAALEEELSKARAASGKQAVSAMDDQMKAEKAVLARALSEGDSEAAAEAQARMAELAADRKAAQMMAEDAASAPARPPVKPPHVEEWLEKNADWYGVDEERTALANAADQVVRKRGIPPSDPRYTQEIDNYLTKYGAKPAEADAGDDAEPEPAPRRPASGPAPVGGTRPSAGARPRGAGDGPVRLTREQVEAAEAMGMTPERYAASIKALGRAGAFKDPKFMGVR